MSTQEYEGVTIIKKMMHSDLVSVSNKFSSILKIIIDEPGSEPLVSSFQSSIESFNRLYLLSFL